MSSLWTIIERENPPGPRQAVGPLQHLLRTCAASPSLLQSASELFDDLPGPSVLCFGQIFVDIPPAVETISAIGDDVAAIARLRCEKGILRVGIKGETRLWMNGDEELTEDHDDLGYAKSGQIGIELTQFIVAFELRGRRGRYYERYMETTTRPPGSNRFRHRRVSSDSWLNPGRPMSDKDYELDLVHSLAPVTSQTIAGYLAGRAPQLVSMGSLTHTLAGYFIMPRPCRVKFSPPLVPILSQFESTPVKDGLSLYFNARLTPFDSFLVDATIFAVLGQDTNCRVEAFDQTEGRAVVRLVAGDSRDLFKVAEALSQRVWEQAHRGQAVANQGAIEQQFNAGRDIHIGDNTGRLADELRAQRESYELQLRAKDEQLTLLQGRLAEAVSELVNRIQRITWRPGPEEEGGERTWVVRERSS